MASPEARKCECTTAPQGHRPEIQAPSLVRGECTTAPQSHEPEIQAPSLVRGECTSRRKKEEREEEEREKEEEKEERDVQYNKQNLTQGVRKKLGLGSIFTSWDLTIRIPRRKLRI